MVSPHGQYKQFMGNFHHPCFRQWKRYKNTRIFFNPMKHICILGGGRVGSAIAMDLSKDKNLQVTVIDKEKKMANWLKKPFEIDRRTMDLSDPKTISKIVEDFDFVVDALPGAMGYKTLKTVINTGKLICDVSFFPENPFTLNDAARKKQVTAVVDCGIAPGLSNIIVGYASSQMESIEDIKILVGGLPKNPDNILKYKAPFSPADVIEEYVRPVKCVRNNRVITLSALSELETVKIPGVGELEAFNTDGLRTLIHTIRARNMVEKTLRYPGHAEKMFFLRETGFFKDTLIKINDTMVKPLDVTTSLLFPLWRFKEGEKDFTVMEITIKGLRVGIKTTFVFSLFDEADVETGMLSMART
ncbi:MAG TPA: saccharopine dehydrogenase family protein, partial [Thermoplasmatales archaeon]|nr:saccharopine dehydrogenase family protein [Thermoplasmatales archaeon]